MDTQNEIPVINYILNEPEDCKDKILLPLLHANNRQIMFAMPTTIVINPGESKNVDFKIRIKFPHYNLMGRFGIPKLTRKSFDIEIRNADMEGG